MNTVWLMWCEASYFMRVRLEYCFCLWSVWCLLQFFVYGQILRICNTHHPTPLNWFLFRCVYVVHCTYGFYVMFLITQPDEWRLVLFNYTNTCKSARCDGNAMRLYQLLLHCVRLVRGYNDGPPIYMRCRFYLTHYEWAQFVSVIPALHSIIVYFVYVRNDSLLRVRILWWVTGWCLGV